MKIRIHLFHFIWLFVGTAVAEVRASINLIRESQIHMARAETQLAEAALDRLEKQEPAVVKNPHFSYQRFFVALHGRGDRTTARLMLRRLDELVADGLLDPESAIYRVCTEEWARSILLTDVELHASNRSRMTQRLKNLEP